MNSFIVSNMLKKVECPHFTSDVIRQRNNTIAIAYKINATKHLAINTIVSIGFSPSTSKVNFHGRIPMFSEAPNSLYLLFFP